MATSRMLDYIAQPDARTCQSACVLMMTGDPDKIGVLGVRAALERLGEPGNPYVMGEYLKPRVREYAFDPKSSISDMVGWIEDGYRLITHGYFSNSGHVIVISGYKVDCFTVDDPYGEFYVSPHWRYSNNENGDDLPYSERLIYSTCVASGDRDGARKIYNSWIINRNFKDAWVHRIKN